MCCGGNGFQVRDVLAMVYGSQHGMHVARRKKSCTLDALVEGKKLHRDADSRISHIIFHKSICPRWLLSVTRNLARPAQNLQLHRQQFDSRRE